MSVKWVVGGVANGSAVIEYSYDGTTFTNSSNASSLFNIIVYGIAHNGSVWVASGYNNGTAGKYCLGYSYDANTWFGSTSGTSVFVEANNVCYGNGMFVATGAGGSYSIAYSYDGITWTGCASSSFFPTNCKGYSIAYANSMWLIGGANFGGANGSQLIGYSTNGINWTLSNSNGLDSIIGGFDYNGTNWAAVGNNTSNNRFALYSSDGINWSSASGGSGLGRGVKWNGSKFIAIGAASTLYTSITGTSWTSGASVTGTSINYNNGQWLAGGSSIQYSSDGTNWSNATHQLGSTGVGVRTIAYAIVPPVYPCFLEGSKILSLDPFTGQESYVPIETLNPGDLIKTADSGYKAIVLIGKKTIDNSNTKINNKLFVMKKNEHMLDDLVLTGEHCILHKEISPELRTKIHESMGDVYITESYYRVPAYLDDKFEPYPVKGQATIWHLALEHEIPEWNYGIYANGLLVESCSIRYMSEIDGMVIQQIYE